MELKPFGAVRLTGGEGPLWDHHSLRLLAVDIVTKAAFQFDERGLAVAQVLLPEAPIGVFHDREGGTVVVLSDRLCQLDWESGDLTCVKHIPLAQGARINDAKVDPSGRLLLVSADPAMSSPRGQILRVEIDGSVTVLDRGFIVGNGPCWSPSGATLYVSDSMAQKTYCYEYPTDGALGDRRIFADTEQFSGMPDGATVDAAGRVWIAICGGGKIVAFSADGTIDRILEAPTRWVSSVTFGGGVPR